MTFDRFNFGLFDSGTYLPYAVDISAISRAVQATVTTTEAHGFEVGNLIQFRIPQEYGMEQLDGQKAYVVEVPSDTTCVIDIDSSAFNPFATPSLPPYVVIDPAQILAIGDENFNQFFSGSNTTLPRTMQGAFTNQPP